MTPKTLSEVERIRWMINLFAENMKKRMIEEYLEKGRTGWESLHMSESLAEAKRNLDKASLNHNDMKSIEDAAIYCAISTFNY